MKLPTFRSLKAKLTTSDDVVAAMGTNAAQLASARAELCDMERQRPGLLLDGDDASIDTLDARLVDVRRLVARLEARSDALEEELAAAGAREASEALTRLAAETKVRADAAERWLRQEYPAHARGIVAGLLELAAAERAVRKANDALSAAGRGDEALPKIETRVHGAASIGSLTYNTSLMAVPALDAPSYGNPIGIPWVFGVPGDHHQRG